MAQSFVGAAVCSTCEAAPVPRPPQPISANLIASEPAAWTLRPVAVKTAPAAIVETVVGRNPDVTLIIGMLLLQERAPKPSHVGIIALGAAFHPKVVGTNPSSSP